MVGSIVEKFWFLKFVSIPNTNLEKVKKNQNISLRQNMYNNALKKVGADSAPPPSVSNRVNCVYFLKKFVID